MFRTSLLTAAFAIGCLSAASAATIDFRGTLSGKTEVPPTTSNASGDVLATLDTGSKKLTYTITYIGLSGPATAAHFHGPAAAGANAGVAVPIGSNPASPSSGSVTLTDAQIKDLEAGNWYANVHTEANKGGEIRGQLMRVK
jgi:CHRD domain